MKEAIVKIPLVYLSLAVLLAVPVDAVWVQSWRPGETEVVSAPKVKEKAWKSEAQYLQDFEKTTLFGKASQGADGTMLQQSLTELVKDWRLKGVILGNKPEAILWNAQTQKSVFVKLGSTVGELNVKEIKKGSVGLVGRGEIIELTME